MVQFRQKVYRTWFKLLIVHKIELKTPKPKAEKIQKINMSVKNAEMFGKRVSSLKNMQQNFVIGHA